ncbi:MAG: amidohydrolase [Robiginitalea sp.]
MQNPDLLLTNARIWTGNPEQPWAEAMLISEGKILETGTAVTLDPWKEKAGEVVDASGAFVVPGFIDSHVHFLTGGLALASVQLRDARTPAEFIQRIGAFARENPGNWIRGGDWDHEQWGGELPTRHWIDSLTPETPVFVRRLDGHMGLANSKALELAGIDSATPDVDGGEIVREPDGTPTGVLKDNAMGLVDRAMPEPGETAYFKALEAAMDYVASQGVTSVHHVGGTDPVGYLELFQKAREQGKLRTRIYALTPLSRWKWLDRKLKEGLRSDEWVRFGGLKGFSDGSLGSHTAAFKEPYSDQPGEYGLFITPKDSLENWILGADGAGLQVAVHAIGDDAISFVLDSFKKAIAQNGPRDRRFRIEHAQHIAQEDLHRFAELGVIPSMQPYHAIDDGRWAERVIGNRIQNTYAFRSLLDAGARLAFGSDWFVAPPDPLYGIYAAVTRRTLDGAYPDGWVPEQKITVEEALKAYTTGSAYASFEADIKGSLQPGKLADFVMLSENLFEISPEHIKDVKILQTWVGGKQVYSGKKKP